MTSVNNDIWGDDINEEELVAALETSEQKNMWGDDVSEEELVAALEATEVELAAAAKQTTPKQPRTYQQVLEEYNNASEYAFKKWCAQPQCSEQEEEMEEDFRLVTKLEEELQQAKELSQ